VSSDFDQKVVAVLDGYGIQNARACVEAQSHPCRPILSQCVALLENETGGGRNVFGGEGTACPVEWYEQPVTEERYVVYRERRDHGMTPNGVGPTQLTNPELQIEAQELGGCWVPVHNMNVGFSFLHQLMVEHGSAQEGFRVYNGSGPAAVAYSERAMRWATIWHDRFKAHGLT
jgi:hypothetical protein